MRSACRSVGVLMFYSDHLSSPPPHLRTPLTVREWVKIALRENDGDRHRAIVWVHSVWGENPGAERLHALAKVILFLAEEEV